MRNLIPLALAALVPFAAAATPPVPPLVDSTWVRAKACNPGVVALDIRSEKIDGQSRSDYREGHIPCAVHSDYMKAGWHSRIDGVPGMLPPVEELEQLIGGVGIDNDTHVIVVSRGDSAKSMGSAARVYWVFKVLGHDRISILDGGITAYTADTQNRLEPGMRHPAARPFRAKLREDMVVSGHDVEQAIANGDPMVDYRETDQYLGVNRDPKVKQAGTLPGAANLPISWLTVDDGGRYRSQVGLEQAYRLADIATHRGHIAFCNTGHNAAMGWFVASELLGHEGVRLYDGSMADWTRQQQAAVDRRLAIAN